MTETNTIETNVVNNDLWYPQEIFVHNKVRNDPTTISILSKCSNITPQYIGRIGVPVEGEEANRAIISEITSRSNILEGVEFGRDLVIASKKILYIAPSGADTVSPFVIKEKEIMCPQFERLNFTSNGCYYNCQWCYLQGTYRAVWPFVTVRVQYDKMKTKIINKLKKSKEPILFNCGEMGDSLSLEHLTGAAEYFIRFFSTTKNGYLYMLTKSDNIYELMQNPDIIGLENKEHAIFAWSINNEEVSRRFELVAPGLEKRLRAAKTVQDNGFRVRLRLDPIVPIEDWAQKYSDTVDTIFDKYELNPENITIGTLRFENGFYGNRFHYFSDDLNEIIKDLPRMDGITNKGKRTFPTEQRIKMFKFIIGKIRAKSDCAIGLCKESLDVWDRIGYGLTISDVNCICQYAGVNLSPEFSKSQIYHIDPNELKTDPEQPRKTFDDASLDGLADSIKVNGINNPIIIRVDENNNKVIVAGERRFRAATKLGLATVPCIYTNNDKYLVSLIENIQREELTVVEIAENISMIKELKRYKQKELIKVIGKPQSVISDILKINSLSPEIRDKFRGDRKISRGILVELTKLRSEDEINSYIERYEQGQLNSRVEVRQARTTQETPTIDEFVSALKTVRTLTNRINSINENIAEIDTRSETFNLFLDEINAFSTTFNDFIEAISNIRQTDIENETE